MNNRKVFTSCTLRCSSAVCTVTTFCTHRCIDMNGYIVVESARCTIVDIPLLWIFTLIITVVIHALSQEMLQGCSTQVMLHICSGICVMSGRLQLLAHRWKLLDLYDIEAYCAKYLLELCVTSMGVGSFMSTNDQNWDVPYRVKAWEKLGVSGAPWTRKIFYALGVHKVGFCTRFLVGFFFLF